MTDNQVINSIVLGGRPLESATQHLLKTNIGLMYDVKSKLKLPSEDIKDLYADAISHLVWNIRTNKFKGRSKVGTYLYKIFYNKSVDHVRHLSTNKNRDTLDIDSLTIESPIASEHQAYQRLAFNEVKKEILILKSPCKDIIMDWAYYGYSMIEIAERNKIENADKAKKAKYTCLQRLREILKSKNLY